MLQHNGFTKKKKQYIKYPYIFIKKLEHTLVFFIFVKFLMITFCFCWCLLFWWAFSSLCRCLFGARLQSNTNGVVRFSQDFVYSWNYVVHKSVVLWNVNCRHSSAEILHCTYGKSFILLYTRLYNRATFKAFSYKCSNKENGITYKFSSNASVGHVIQTYLHYFSLTDYKI